MRDLFKLFTAWQRLLPPSSQSLHHWALADKAPSRVLLESARSLAGKAVEMTAEKDLTQLTGRLVVDSTGKFIFFLKLSQ
jgi:hypothetical protein